MKDNKYRLSKKAKIMIGAFSSTLIVTLALGVSIPMALSFKKDNVDLPDQNTPEDELFNTLESTKDLQDKYHYDEVKFKNLTSGTGDKSFSNAGRGYYYEAEEAILTAPGRIESNNSCSNGKNVGKLEYGAQMTFTITVEEDTDALLTFSACTYNNSPDGDAWKLKNEICYINYGSNLTLLNNEVKLGDRTLNGAGSWNVYENVAFGEVHLQKGTNYIQYTSKQPVNYDYMALLSVYNPEEDKEEVEPTPEEPDLNEKYGTPRRTYLNKANGNEFNIDNYGYIYQAEEASLSEGVNISKENLNAMNNHHIQNVNVGRSFTFEINAREETEALLMLGMVVNGDNGVKIKLDDIFEITYGTSSDNLDKKVFTNSRELEKSNTWDSFRDTVVGEIKLSKGKNIIKVSTTKFAANYDYMSLVSPLDKGEKAPLEKESDIVKTYGEVNLAKKEELEKGDETSFNLTKKGFVYEAEKGEIFNARIANNSTVDNFKAGGSVTFTIKSSIDTKALMTINTSMWHIWDAPIYEMMTVTYGTNKNELVNTANSYDHFMPAQGDWNNYQNHIVGEINLKKGINYIKVKELTSFNIDYISLFNQLDKIDPSAPVDPVPDPEPKPDPEIKGDWKDVYGVCVQKDLKDGSESKKFDDANRGYYFEAESAKLFGDSKLEDNPNASGGKFVNRIRTSNGKASGLIFEIESSKDRKTLLKTAFAQARRDRHAFKDLLKVEVGQSEEALKEVSIDQNYIFEGTNGWTDFKEDVVGEISLTKGKNIIKITGLQSGDKALNCDYISLLNPYKDESTDSEYIKNTYGTWKYEDLASTDESFNLIKEKRGTIFEAEKAERSETLKVETGKQGVSCESNISGFGKDEYLTFTVNAKEDTKCLLVIAASGADDRFIPVSSLFNVTYGTSKETLDSKVNSYERYYQYSNDWMKYNNAMVGEVSLKAGVNIIKVIGSVPSDIYQMNIDYMALINAL